jgi:hypothetical protein
MLGSSMKKIGIFEIESASVRVSDICLRHDENIADFSLLDNVKRGIWVALRSGDSFVGHADDLIIHHADHELNSNTQWDATLIQHEDIESGQVGIFDSKYFNSDLIAKDTVMSENFPEDYRWYLMCCDATKKSPDGCAVVPYGIVSNVESNTGSYSAYVSNNLKGEVVAVRIVFDAENPDEFDEFDVDDDFYDDDDIDDLDEDWGGDAA